MHAAKAMGGGGTADTLESLDANNTPLTQRDGRTALSCGTPLESWRRCASMRVREQPNPQVSQQNEGTVTRKKRKEMLRNNVTGTTQIPASEVGQPLFVST